MLLKPCRRPRNPLDGHYYDDNVAIMAQGTIWLVDGCGRKYLTTEERGGFVATAACEPKPERQAFALTLAHSGARLSEVLAVRPRDVDLDASAVRIRTLKRRAEHWRKVPLPAETLRVLELVHGLLGIPPQRAGDPLWPWSRATSHRRIAAVMDRAGIARPQSCPKGLCHAFGIAVGVPLPTIAAMLGHADISTTAIYTTAVGIEARTFLARMWEHPNAGSSVGRSPPRNPHSLPGAWPDR